jgi:hypothetical protein
VALDPTSRHERALMSPCVPWCQTPPLDTERLWRHDMPHGTRPHLPAQEGSGIVMCPVAPDQPLSEGGLQRRHVSHGSKHTTGRQQCRVTRWHYAAKPLQCWVTCQPDAIPDMCATWRSDMTWHSSGCQQHHWLLLASGPLWYRGPTTLGPPVGP